MEGSALITVGLPASLFIIMIGMGLALQITDFRRVAEQPKAVAIGTVLQLIGVPALGFLIGGLTGGGVMAAGLVLVAALPGGTTSNVLCYLARANLALSITLTVIASLLTIVTIPLYVNYALVTFVGGSDTFYLPFTQTLITMLVIVVIPVGLGMLVRSRAPAFATRIEPAISKFAVFVLLAIIVAIIVSQRANLLGWLAVAWFPVLALNLSALGLGLLCGKLARVPFADSLTMAIELGIKNTTLGLTIALSLLGSTELALPAAIYGLVMYASVAGLAVLGRRANPQVAAAAPE